MNLIDQNFKGIEGLEDWNAKSQFHKLLSPITQPISKFSKNTENQVFSVFFVLRHTI